MVLKKKIRRDSVSSNIFKIFYFFLNMDFSSLLFRDNQIMVAMMML